MGCVDDGEDAGTGPRNGDLARAAGEGKKDGEEVRKERFKCHSEA